MQRARSIATAVVTVVTLVVAPAAAAHRTVAPQVAEPSFLAFAGPKTGRLDAAGLRRAGAVGWTSYRTAAAGPTIRVSPAYADSGAIAQRWSSFFQSLLHGPELAVLNAYIAPIEEVRTICGNSDVLGCYGANRLFIPDQGIGGFAATSIATHEYGHHVAFNRLSPPWIAVDWGPKRWATDERVCPRAAVGTAYPGDEGGDYPLNPGEAWAETYRVLNETSAGLPMTWPIIDPSFRPDAAALAAARQDVLDPWAEPTVTAKRVVFGKRARTWTMQVTTPLDGELHAQVQPGSDDVTLVASDGGATLARGTWSSSGAKAFGYVVCGQRTFVLRVTRHTAARRFTLRLSTP
jgi:hypothetical protein